MKKVICFVMCIALAACSLCACGNPDEFSDSEKLSKDYTRSTDPTESYNYNDGAESAPMSYSVYSNSIASFELKLFRNYFSQLSDKTKSSVFAPAGTALQLSLLANGASGDTKDEISLALGKDLTLENLNQCSSYFKSRIEAVSKLNDGKIDSLSGKQREEGQNEYVRFCSNIYFNDISDVKTGFLQTNANFFENSVYRFMFSDKNAVSKINKSLSGFSSDSTFKNLNEKDNMFFVNACNISDLWLEKYSKSDIEKGIFKSDGSEKSVNFLTSNESMIKSKKAQGVIKYTEKNPLKLMLVMPDENITLEDYIADFDYIEFSNLLDSIDITKKVTAKIPEFSVKTGNEAVPLSDALTNSGLYTLFTKDAVFKNLSNTDNFMLNEIYQIAPEITVNASGINNKENIAQNSEHKLEKTDKTVKFDRPFIFLLIDNESNIPIYIGTVDNI